MNQQTQVDEFVAAICQRLNRIHLWNTLLWSAVIATALMVAIGLAYVIPGYAVPLSLFAIIAGSVLLLAVIAWLVSRPTAELAAKFADEHFGLEDAVISCRHFQASGKHGRFYDLQAAQTKQRVAVLQPQTIEYQLPRRAAVMLMIFGIAAIVLGLQAPSQAVQDRIALEKQTIDQTKQINEELTELIDQLEEETKGTEEEDLIEPNKLRQWVQELKETPDRKEALRQYARLERKINEASARLQQKRDEQLLDRAAKELEKDRQTRELAETLKQKKYEDAIEELKELEPKPKEGLTEQRKELARMKAAAHRMSSAAQALHRNQPNEQNKRQLAKLSRQNDSQGSSSKSNSNNSGLSGKGSQSSASELADEIQDLEDAVEDWEDALDELANAEDLEEVDTEKLEKCEVCRGKVGDELDDLGKKLYKLALKRKAQSKLKKLCRACSQCQSGLCNNPRNSPNAGGQKAGWGSNDANREETDELIDNGQFTQIKGIKGQGPSLTTVESAEDGAGAGSRRHESRRRTFQRQVESFVQREDVPEDVKAGVKEYFKNIHQSDEE